MLDESISTNADIERGVRSACRPLTQAQTWKCGGVTRLQQALQRIRARGMSSVLGNSVAMEISNWMEVCVASVEVDRAGEANDFTRSADGQFANPLQIVQVNLILPAGSQPAVDRDRIE